MILNFLVVLGKIFVYNTFKRKLILFSVSIIQFVWCSNNLRQTFNYTSGPQIYVVPSDAYVLNVIAVGAGGGIFFCDLLHINISHILF